MVKTYSPCVESALSAAERAFHSASVNVEATIVLASSWNTLTASPPEVRPCDVEVASVLTVPVSWSPSLMEESSSRSKASAVTEALPTVLSAPKLVVAAALAAAVKTAL